jgi:hypothetical protein
VADTQCCGTLFYFSAGHAGEKMPRCCLKTLLLLSISPAGGIEPWTSGSGSRAQEALPLDEFRAVPGLWW